METEYRTEGAKLDSPGKPPPPLVVSPGAQPDGVASDAGMGNGKKMLGKKMGDGEWFLNRRKQRERRGKKKATGRRRLPSFVCFVAFCSIPSAYCDRQKPRRGCNQ